MDYDGCAAWLFSTQSFGVKLGLDNISRLLQSLDLPGDHPHVLHVAGTNGKGSTCAFAESICRTQGLRTGLFTSPHLLRVNERIRVDFQPVSDAQFVRLTSQFREAVSNWNPPPTFFELTLAIALLHFREEAVDVVILETGMGGRLDATSAVTPTSTAITRIGLDHTQWLGDNLTAIAGEKAGIIKPGVALAVAPQKPAAEHVITLRATELGSPLIKISPADCPAIDLGLKGLHQRENAALAIQLIACSGITLFPEKIAQALADTTWPARFQIIHLPDRTHPIVIDGAHNPDSASILVETWHAYFPQTQATLLFASLKEKDTRTLFSTLVPIAHKVIITETGTTRSIPANHLAAVVEKILPRHAEPPQVIADAKEAFIQAIEDDSRPVLVAGSLFLAAITLAQIGNRDHQASLQ